MTIKAEKSFDVVCLSHLRWDFVFQRPQHLMSRFAKARRVFYVEEAIFDESPAPRLANLVCKKTKVQVLTPHLPQASQQSDNTGIVNRLLTRFLAENQVKRYVNWFYTPSALDIAEGLKPSAVVYDCMDELSLFKNAPPALAANERRLLASADLVFTGGESLFEAKRSMHSRVYAFPSSVDVAHFSKARTTRPHADQDHLPRPRLGYAGVIDERMDLKLLSELARSRPNWSIVMIGPIVKIDPNTLPKEPNIHYLGSKDYQLLPEYFAGWDAALIPFALNESTRFISPTKTPEYLSAGLPVISTPIRDVIRPYGELGLAKIAATPQEFVHACEQAMTCGMTMKWRERADAFLQTLSWDRTWGAMNELIVETIAEAERPAKVASAYPGFAMGATASV